MKRPVDDIDEYERKAAMRRLLAEEMPKFFARGGQVQIIRGAGAPLDHEKYKRKYRRGATAA